MPGLLELSKLWVEMHNSVSSTARYNKEFVATSNLSYDDINIHDVKLQPLAGYQSMLESTFLTLLLDNKANVLWSKIPSMRLIKERELHVNPNSI